MDLLALLRKEATSIRRNAALLVVLLVLLPAAIPAGTAVYEQTIPQDVPVGIVPQDEATSSEDLDVVRGGVAFFATPVDFESNEAAVRALAREEVYLVIRVPGGLGDPGRDVNFTVVSDEAMVPFREPANLSADVMDAELDDLLPADVDVLQERYNERRGLSEYLVPSALVAFVALYALVFVPAMVREERLVLDRLRTESRIETVLASKLLAYGALLALPLASLHVAASLLGYRLDFAAPLTLASVGLTFLGLAAVGLAVLFALRLSGGAIYANIGIVLGLVAMSSLVYPVGFFSTTRKTIARTLPTHYSAITVRSGTMRDVSAALYADYLAYLAVTAVVALVALEVAIVAYRRRS